MASQTVSNDIARVSPEQLHSAVERLVTEDDTPVVNIFSEKQQRLLIDPLFSSWVRPGEDKRFVAMANVGLFYAISQPPYVPDMLLSLDVELPTDIHPKPHRSYFFWEYGKSPDVVVEVVSNREGGEDSDKLAGYARIGVRYYVIFDPDGLLSDRPLRAYCLEARGYREITEPIWSAGVELGMQLWQGRYEDWDNTWLRWVDEQQKPLPTAFVRAEQERQRADRLAEQLRRLGAEPEV
jgi:Uma2 family endonuclease